MAHLARGAVSTAVAPLLSLRTCDRGVVSDPDDGSLTWTIVDVTTDARELSPSTVAGPISVDLDDDRVEEQTGHFAAVGNPLIPSDAEIGAHEIRWSWTVDGKAHSYAERFDVLEGVPRGLGGGYALVSDFRREDVCEEGASTVRLLRLIAEQSQEIERWTRRWFEPRLLEIQVDGTGQNTLLLGQPIIALSSVKIVDQPIAVDFDSDELRVYNRHLTGMLDPDDRVSPRISLPLLRWPYELGGTWSGLFSSSPSIRRSFPAYEQNVRVEGIFGYTDPDGTHLGKTPDAIRRATMLLVQRRLPSLADTDAAFDAQEGHRVKRIKTRDQEIEYDQRLVAGTLAITGDPTIDRLLTPFMSALRVGST